MYDTLTFVISQADYNDISFIEIIPQYLTTIQANGESHQGYFVNGYLDTFRVNINTNRIKIEASSLARYINGDNQQGMSLQLTREAIQKLSDQLHLDVGQAKVTRIDFGRNIITKFKPETYLPYLGESVGYKRQQAGDGVYYKNSTRILAFYDKIKEQKAKRHEVQKLFMGRNLLRYELRLKSHLERELNRTRVNGMLLCDEDFYIQLGKLWRDQYMKIIKLSSKTATFHPTQSTRDLMLSLAAMTVQDIGDDALLRMIAEWQQQETITNKQASDHRKLIRDIVRRDRKALGNEFIDELDKKVKQATRFYI